MVSHHDILHELYMYMYMYLESSLAGTLIDAESGVGIDQCHMLHADALLPPDLVLGTLLVGQYWKQV